MHNTAESNVNITSRKIKKSYWELSLSAPLQMRIALNKLLLKINFTFSKNENCSFFHIWICYNKCLFKNLSDAFKNTAFWTIKAIPTFL